MGMLMRIKLEAMPLVDIDNMGAAFLALASVSVEPEVLKWMKANHKTQMSKYCKYYGSLAEIDAYAIEQKRWGNKMLGLFDWKRVGPYLVLFGGVKALIRLGSPPSAYVYIIRTGQSTWRTYDLSAIEQDIGDSSDNTLYIEAEDKAKTVKQNLEEYRRWMDGGYLKRNLK